MVYKLLMNPYGMVTSLQHVLGKYVLLLKDYNLVKVIKTSIVIDHLETQWKQQLYLHLDQIKTLSRNYELVCIIPSFSRNNDRIRFLIGKWWRSVFLPS